MRFLRFRILLCHGQRQNALVEDAKRRYRVVGRLETVSGQGSSGKSQMNQVCTVGVYTDYRIAIEDAMTSRPAEKSHGFTLIEQLVVVSITGNTVINNQEITEDEAKKT